MRKDIKISTLNRIKDFLKNQKEPVYITDIVKKLHVNLDSVKFALVIIKHKVNKLGKISVRK